MRQDNRHCVLCGEPTSARYCVDCEKAARAIAEWESEVDI